MPRTIIPKDSVDGIIQATFEIGRMMRRRFIASDGHDIHMGQLHALALIQGTKGITMKQLADQMMITSPSATSFIDRLATLGYVRRLRDAQNRKLVRLSITKLGAKILKQKTAQKKKIFMELFAPLSTDDRKTLLAVLRKVLRGAQ